jgi:hypothetical protein
MLFPSWRRGSRTMGSNAWPVKDRANGSEVAEIIRREALKAPAPRPHGALYGDAAATRETDRA